MNTFLNENWKELVQVFAPPISEATAQIFQKIITNIYQLVTYDESFPEPV
jgi:hypothetical protein